MPDIGVCADTGAGMFRNATTCSTLRAAMLCLSTDQLLSLKTCRLDSLSSRLRREAMKMRARQALAGSEPAWSAWWRHVERDAAEVHAETMRTLATHASFCL